jgi:outer membrane protein assembly factor BamA
LNTEYRFPLWGRIGGNVFIDAGCVWPSLKKIKLKSSAVDVGWGLRYYLKNFLARFDMGFSKEGTGIYFNFGHIF